MKCLLAGALLLAACAVAPTPRAPFALAALLADAPGYVAARYSADALPAALIADLEADGFNCQHSATASDCGRARHAFASCWDVVTVRITTSNVNAEEHRRCMGAMP